MNRNTITASQARVGQTVFRGQGAVPYRITDVREFMGRTFVTIRKLASTSTGRTVEFPLSDITVDPIDLIDLPGAEEVADDTTTAEVAPTTHRSIPLIRRAATTEAQPTASNTVRADTVVLRTRDGQGQLAAIYITPGAARELARQLLAAAFDADGVA